MSTMQGLGYPPNAPLVNTEGIQSVPGAFQRTVRRFPDGVAMRLVDDSVRLTWRDVAERVRLLAGSLAAIGVGRGDAIAILMRNRPEHQLIDLAALHLGATVTSIYNSLSPADIAFVIQDCGAEVLVTERQFVGSLRRAIDLGTSPRQVVVVDGTGEEHLPNAIDLRDFEELAAPAGFDFDASWSSVRRTDLALVCYTSGTTSRPKGVQLCHDNVLHTAAGYSEVAELAPGARLISAFPLAHIGERIGTYYLAVLQGYAVTFCPDIALLDEYYLRVRPQYVFMTPRSLERYRAKIENSIRMEPDPKLRQRKRRAVEFGVVRAAARQRGWQSCDASEDEWLELRSVATGLLAEVGLDKVEFSGIGAAPVPPSLLTYFLGLGFPAGEGWGLTECCGVGTLTRRDDVRVGYAGPAFPGTQLRLSDDGEILVRSAGVMVGYRNLPEETKAVIDEDGWLRSGDVGELDADGFLRLVDRKKDIIITSNGKNISPIRVETALKSAGDLIGHAVAVGDGRPYLTALLVLEPEGVHGSGNAGDAAGPDGASGTPSADLLAAVQHQVDAGNAVLSAAERVRKWVLLGAADWVPGGDELTPTMKLKRRSIAQKYAAEIESMY